MYRQGGIAGGPSAFSYGSRRFSRCVKLGSVGLVMTCMAIGQTATQPESPGRVGATDKQAAVSPSDGSAPITQNQAAALLEEMRRLELLLSSRTASPGAANAAPDTGATKPKAGPITLPLRAAEHSLGDPGAPIVMVEFADLQCPFCKDFQESTFPALENAYIKTGRVRFVVRDLPLSIHPYARSAAEAIRCAGEQGKYWELRNALLTGSEPPSTATIAAAAGDIHLEKKKFDECQSRHTFSSDIDSEESEAQELGINGTPAFLIGRPQDGKIIGTVIQGNRGVDVYRREIEKILNQNTEHTGSVVEPRKPIFNSTDKPI